MLNFLKAATQKTLALVVTSHYLIFLMFYEVSVLDRNETKHLSEYR